MAKKNAAAVALAKLRAKRLTPQRRIEISEMGNAARMKKLSPNRRQEIARKAAAARWGKKQ
jgi:hypothetical protein